MFRGQEEGSTMIDAEVARLRKLRNVALRARAVAAVLSAEPATQHRAITQSAVIAWRVARMVTGRLRAHPNLRIQKRPSCIRYGFNGAFAFLIGTTALYRGRVLYAHAAELRLLARELDDTRALTWDLDWSDTLGRAQRQLRRLIPELAGGAGNAVPVAGARIGSNSRLAANGPRSEVAIAADWPYLAI